MWNRNRTKTRFFAAFLLSIVAVFAQLRLGAFFDITGDITLMTLVALSLFLDIAELFPLALGCASLLKWDRSMNPEFLGILLIPFVALGLKRILPWKTWISGMVISFLSAAGFYALSNISVFRSGLVLWEIIVFDMIFAAIIFHTFEYFYAE
jgi:hypothetical protein